jgi:hypothetical protein
MGEREEDIEGIAELDCDLLCAGGVKLEGTMGGVERVEEDFGRGDAVLGGDGVGDPLLAKRLLRRSATVCGLYVMLKSHLASSGSERVVAWSVRSKVTEGYADTRCSSGRPGRRVNKPGDISGKRRCD